MGRSKKNFTREQLDEAYSQMTVYSDVLSQVFFKDEPEITTHILRIILNMPDLCVTQVKVQEEINNPFGHSVRFDVLATDSQNNFYNIEIQNANSPNLLRRADYYGAAIKMKHLKKKADYLKMPKAFVIFIVKDGMYCEGLPVNRILMRDDAQKIYDVGTQIYFVNGQLQDDTPLGKLMHDFACNDPSQMRDPVMAKHFRGAIQRKKNMDAIQMKLYNSAVADGMEKGLKKGRKEGREEGRKEGREEGRKEGREEGRKEGREEGRKEGREEGLKKGVEKGNISAQCKIVEHMHSVGMDEQDIVRCSGVSAEVVAKILRGIYK